MLAMTQALLAADEPQPMVDLDGFTLLEAARVEDPEDAIEAVLNNCRLGGAVAEDLSYFSRLRYLDVGENQVQLASLAPLVSLEELHLHCNGLTTIDVPVMDEGDVEIAAFPLLHTLNLSYNLLSSQSLEKLSMLTSLRLLDLSYNSLGDSDFPPDLSYLRNLECLSLEKNNLSAHEEVFSALASIPSLRELNLNQNLFEQIPKLQFPFEKLQVLSVAHNRLSTYESLLACLDCPAITTVIAHGNPVDLFPADKQALMEDFEDSSVQIMFDSSEVLPKRPPVGIFYQAAAQTLQKVNTTLPRVPKDKKKRKKKAQKSEIMPELRMEQLPRESFFITGGDGAPIIEEHDDSASEVSEEDAAQEAPHEEVISSRSNQFRSLRGSAASTTRPGSIGSVFSSNLMTSRSIAQTPPTLRRGTMVRPRPQTMKTALNALKYALEHPLTAPMPVKFHSVKY
jgi:hypothetical protein